jgi:hypothetical protein
MLISFRCISLCPLRRACASRSCLLASGTVRAPVSSGLAAGQAARARRRSGSPCRRARNLRTGAVAWRFRSVHRRADAAHIWANTFRSPPFHVHLPPRPTAQLTIRFRDRHQENPGPGFQALHGRRYAHPRLSVHIITEFEPAIPHGQRRHRTTKAPPERSSPVGLSLHKDGTPWRPEAESNRTRYPSTLCRRAAAPAATQATPKIAR